MSNKNKIVDDFPIFLDSGDPTIDRAFNGILKDAKNKIYSSLLEANLKLRLKNLLKKVPDYEELIIIRLEYALRHWLEWEEKRGHFNPEWPFHKDSLRAQKFYRWLGKEYKYPVGKMKTTFIDGMEHQEYFYEDWETGHISTGWFRYAGNHRITSSDTGITRIQKITQVEFDKIRNAAKEIFHKEVDHGFTYLKNSFIDTYERSEDRPRLLQFEIEDIEKKFGIREGKPFGNMVYYVQSYSQLYHNHKKLGKPFDYTLTQSDNFPINRGQDRVLIMFEAEWLFWKWLQEFKNPDKKNIAETESPVPLHFDSFFHRQSDYHNIIQILVDNGSCEPITNSWKDNSKGSKSLLVALIKSLHFKRYFIRKPTDKEIILIGKTFFDCNLSLGTVKAVKQDSMEKGTVIAKIPVCEYENTKTIDKLD